MRKMLSVMMAAAIAGSLLAGCSSSKIETIAAASSAEETTTAAEETTTEAASESAAHRRFPEAYQQTCSQYPARVSHSRTVLPHLRSPDHARSPGPSHFPGACWRRSPQHLWRRLPGQGVFHPESRSHRHGFQMLSE